MKNDNFFELFSFLSKAIIAIPIVVVVSALVIKFDQKPQTKKTIPIPITSIPTPKPTTPKINFNLKGPLVCQGKVDEASVSAYIQDKKIKIIFINKNETENILVSGDCFYNWDQGAFSGRRVCGLSPLLSVAETMANFGSLRADLLFQQLNSFGINNKIATDQAKIAELVNTCKKKVVDNKIFVIPTNILFRNNQ